MARVIIGMDPHKRSATIEIINDREKVFAQGRFGTDTAGYQAMLTLARQYPERLWAVEGCNGIGRHIAQRLVADGETVVDVPAKLSARARVFATGQGRKTDPVDAHSVAVAALRAQGLRPVAVDGAAVALRLLVDRRDYLGRARTDTINRLHQLLLELVPGGAKKFLSAAQARALLNTVRPRDVVGRTRRQLAAELITELAVIDKKIKAANLQLTEGRAYYRRKLAAGKTTMEAIRALKRRLSDLVYRQMLHDAALGQTRTGPGGHQGTSTDSSVTGSHPHAGSSDQSLPGPATDDHTRPAHTARSSPSSPRPLSSADPQPASSALCLTPARTGAP